MKTKLESNNKKLEKKIIFTVFFIMFTAYLVTAEAYFGSDPKEIFKVTTSIVEQQNIPGFVFGETRSAGKTDNFPLCYDGMLCGRYPVFDSVMFIPFIVIQDVFHPISDDIKWHNAEPEKIFTALFFGPLLMSFSVVLVYLILREFKFDQKISLTVTFLYGFATTAWPLSQTSINIVPEMFFILGGTLFVVKFLNKNSKSYIFISGVFFTFALHTRIDSLLIIGIVICFLVWQMFLKKYSFKKLVYFLSPVISGIGVYAAVNLIRFNSISEFGYGLYGRGDLFLYPIHLGLFGQLFSPGYGLILYCPLVLTAVFSFKDFAKKNREFSFLFLGFFVAFLVLYATKVFWSGGSVTWGPRYLFPVTVFLIIPLASSIEIRKESIFKIFLSITAILGLIINFIAIPKNLVSVYNCNLGGYSCFKQIPGLSPSFVINNPAYSNLSSAINVNNDVPPDIFLYNIFGGISFVIAGIIIALLFIYLIRTVRTGHHQNKFLKN